MGKSIKSRLSYSFMLIIIITIFIFSLILSNVIQDYYHKSLENALNQKIEYALDLYSRYYSTLSLEEILLDDIDIFGDSSQVQMQILSLEGDLLMDSLGSSIDEPIASKDVTSAIAGERAVWVGNVSYDSHPVMATSMILKSYGEPIGLIRFITSMEETNIQIKRLTFLLIGLGLLVVVISGFVSVILADSIINPLVEVTNTAEKMAEGQFKVRSNLVLNDEIGRLSNTLNYMADEILKREQIKNDFISSISHELRTPLTSIKGWAITLQSEELKDKDLLNDGLKIIEEESDRLTLMVEDLLDFSRFISGRISLEKEWFSIREVLQRISKQYIPKTKAGKLDFSLDIDDKVDLLLADENRIKQVLINILDNAIKFTEEGGSIKLSAYKSENDLVILLEDTGLGIPSEDLPHIMEKFYRGRNSKSNSGLGLSICDEIINLHKGRFVIESVEGEGTQVYVYLPDEEEEK